MVPDQMKPPFVSEKHPPHYLHNKFNRLIGRFNRLDMQFNRLDMQYNRLKP
jgi:hypothetical protein